MAYVSDHNIIIKAEYLRMGYQLHHAKLLSYIEGWEKWKSDQRRKKVEITIGWIASQLHCGVSTVYRYLKDLKDFAIDVIGKKQTFNGRSKARVFEITLKSTMAKMVIYDPETQSYQLPEPPQNSHYDSQTENSSLYINNQLNTNNLSDPDRASEEKREREPQAVISENTKPPTRRTCPKPVLRSRTPIEPLASTPISSGERSSAANYNQTTNNMTEEAGTYTVKREIELYQAKRASRRPLSWLEMGRDNDLWQTKEELNEFRLALTGYARSIGKGEGWVIVVMDGIALNGMSIYWDEWSHGLALGSCDLKQWENAPGVINPSFKAYVENMRFTDAGNSTSKAALLAAQDLLNPIKASVLWQEYQRRLERELAEKLKCDRMGITYDAPSEIKPKVEISPDRTAGTQAVLNVAQAPQIGEMVEVPQLPEATTENRSLPAAEIEYPPIPEELRLKLEGAIGKLDDTAIPSPWEPEEQEDILGIEVTTEPPETLQSIGLIDLVEEIIPDSAPFVEEWKPISREEREAIRDRAAPGLEQKLAAKPTKNAPDIGSAIGTERMRYSHDPETALQWVEDNRSEIMAWLDKQDRSRRSMIVNGNRWMGIT